MAKLPLRFFVSSMTPAQRKWRLQVELLEERLGATALAGLAASMAVLPGTAPRANQALNTDCPVPAASTLDLNTLVVSPETTAVHVADTDRVEFIPTAESAEEDTTPIAPSDADSAARSDETMTAEAETADAFADPLAKAEQVSDAPVLDSRLESRAAREAADEYLAGLFSSAGDDGSPGQGFFAEDNAQNHGDRGPTAAPFGAADSDGHAQQTVQAFTQASHALSATPLSFSWAAGSTLGSVASFNFSAWGFTAESAARAGLVGINWHGEQLLARQDQWIASFAGISGSGAEQVDQINDLLAEAAPGITARASLGSDGLVTLTTPSGMNVQQLVGTLSRVDGFQYVEPDALMRHMAVPNDLSGSLWGLNNGNDADIDAPEAWVTAWGTDLNSNLGTPVIAAVFDTGVDFTHPDLAANIWTNTAETAGDGVDNDNNGFIDDIRGWDFGNGDNDSSPYTTTGSHSHGTHVAGTIAAVGNNGIGVVGVNWNARILSIKVSYDSSGYASWSSFTSGINYVTALRNRGVNIRVSNASYQTATSSSINSALNNYGQAGMLWVTSAGNSNVNVDASSYSSPYMIQVAASDSNDNRASFSNYGVNTVHLAAPGVGILSTVIGGGYASWSGTSMASPHVAGAVALAWAYAPNASVATIRNAILGGVDQKAAWTGLVSTGGRLNTNETLNLLSSLPAAPAAPTNLAATAVSTSQINLSWSDVSNETGYTIERSTNGTSWTQLATVGANITSYASTGLSQNTTYHYRVKASNLGGDSPYSAAASATTQGVPPPNAAPSGLVVLSSSSTQVNLRWTDNSTNETGFYIQRSSNGGKSWSTIATVGSATGETYEYYNDTSVARRKTYTYRVVAYNAGGQSAYSNTATAKT